MVRARIRRAGLLILLGIVAIIGTAVWAWPTEEQVDALADPLQMLNPVVVYQHIISQQRKSAMRELYIEQLLKENQRMRQIMDQWRGGRPCV